MGKGGGGDEKLKMKMGALVFRNDEEDREKKMGLYILFFSFSPLLAIFT